MSFAPNSRRFARTALVGAVLLATLSAVNVAPAKAEGFPGVGSRTAYADALPHYNLGNRYMVREWWEKAVEKYNDAINIYPYDPDVYINLGTALRKMQDNAGAEKAFRKALELNDKDWITWSNLGNMIMMQDRFQEALDCFEKAFQCGAPEADKKAMQENIDGIKKILKNKYGIDIDAIAAEKAAKAKAAAKAAKAGKGKGKGAIAKAGVSAKTASAKANGVSLKAAGPSAVKAAGPSPKTDASSETSVAANWGYEDAKPTNATTQGATATPAALIATPAPPIAATSAPIRAPQKATNLRLADAPSKKKGAAESSQKSPAPAPVGNAPVKETETGFEISIDGASQEEEPEEE